jgi:sugar phosphate isomerase/epimerase
MAPLCPSVLLSQAYASFLAQRGTLIQAAIDAAGMEFFDAIELPTVAAATERKELRQIARDSHWDVMVWASDVQASEHLSLAALDHSERKRAQLRFQDLVRAASECGARRFGFCSPPESPAEHRADAICFFRDELVELSFAARKCGVAVSLEALDRKAHKRGLMGLTAETADFASSIRSVVPEFGLVWDTAHTALNGEDLIESFRLSASHVTAVHFSDAALDPASRQYGDWHMQVGSGDAMKPPVIRRLLTELCESSRSRKTQFTLAIEELNIAPQRSGAECLTQAWNSLGDCL